MKQHKPRFKERDVIEHKEKKWYCIICNERTAAFGEYVEKMRDERVMKTISYQNVFIVSNDANINDGFEYKKFV